MIRKKLLPYGEVAELFTVLLQREIFRLTQGRFREVEGRQAISQIYRDPSGVVSGTIQRAGNKLTCSLARSTLGSISNCGCRPLRETITRARTSTFS